MPKTLHGGCGSGHLVVANNHQGTAATTPSPLAPGQTTSAHLRLTAPHREARLRYTLRNAKDVQSGCGSGHLVVADKQQGTAAITPSPHHCPGAPGMAPGQTTVG